MLDLGVPGHAGTACSPVWDSLQHGHELWAVAARCPAVTTSASGRARSSTARCNGCQSVAEFEAGDLVSGRGATGHDDGELCVGREGVGAGEAARAEQSARDRLRRGGGRTMAEQHLDRRLVPGELAGRSGVVARPRLDEAVGGHLRVADAVEMSGRPVSECGAGTQQRPADVRITARQAGSLRDAAPGTLQITQEDLLAFQLWLTGRVRAGDREHTGIAVAAALDL